MTYELECEKECPTCGQIAIKDKEGHYHPLDLESAPQPEGVEWISVKDRLPKENEHVLLFFGGSHRPVREGYLSRMAYNDETERDFDLPLFVDATRHYGDEGWPDEVRLTYWMPMPASRLPQKSEG